MAIIQTPPRRSGTRGLLKLLDQLTDEIVLVHGKILMCQFSHNQCDALKLSLYLNHMPFTHLGVRNVFIEDISDTVLVYFGDKKETQKYLEVLQQTKNWSQSFPESHRAFYHLSALDKAAYDLRDYLLFGKLPGQAVHELVLKSIRSILPEKGYVEFDVLATIDDTDVFF